MKSLRNVLGITFLLSLGGAGRAGETCLTPEHSWGCFPCDLPIEMEWIGYSTNGEPCSSPNPESTGWWRGLWTLSESETDPYQNSGPPRARQTLYLWLAVSGCGYGFSSGGFTLDSDDQVDSYEHLVDGWHSWTPYADGRGGWATVGAWSLCTPGQQPMDPVLIGAFHLSRVRSVSVAASAAPLSPGSTSWGRIKAIGMAEGERIDE